MNRAKMVLAAFLAVLIIAAGCSPRAAKSAAGNAEPGGSPDAAPPIASGNPDAGGDSVPAAATAGPEAFVALWESTGNIDDYMPDLIAGKEVSAYELLPCFENFSQATWRELEEKHGMDYFNALWSWLDANALGDEQYMRDYYVSLAYLSADGYVTEGLVAILASQWHADPVTFGKCLSERFPAEDSDRLKTGLTHSLEYFNQNLYGVTIRAAGNLYLGAYPSDFPFGLELAEKSRRSFKAESFGETTVVEGDGFQVTYLNPSEGVFNIICLRTTRAGDSSCGVAVGAAESALESLSLSSVSLSYDDEEWFGVCDAAYAFLPEDNGTCAVVFLVKGGLISGIEVINGLDGRPY
ncbi:MAG: hypothetical protein ACOX7P_06420 [Oscillospiraceae bacterium]|jgi:hypothetical protein